MKRIELLEDYGAAKAGTIFIQGLYEPQESYQGSHTRERFYWEEGRPREEMSFLMDDWLVEGEYKIL